MRLIGVSIVVSFLSLQWGAEETCAQEEAAQETTNGFGVLPPEIPVPAATPTAALQNPPATSSNVSLNENATMIATPTASPTVRTKCWDNTTEVYNHINTNGPFFELQTYVFCPNKIYTIGFEEYDGSCCRDGERQLTLRSNVKFVCGEDGKLENNCIFNGGMAQVIAWGGDPWEDDAFNVHIEGLTFERGGDVSAVFLAIKGEITFKNCVFRGSKTPSVIMMHEPFDPNAEYDDEYLDDEYLFDDEEIPDDKGTVKEDDAEILAEIGEIPDEKETVKEDNNKIAEAADISADNNRLLRVKNQPEKGSSLLRNKEFVRGLVADARKAAKSASESGNLPATTSTNNMDSRGLQVQDKMLVRFIECLFENNMNNEGTIAVLGSQNEAHITDSVFRKNSVYSEEGEVGAGILVEPGNKLKLENNCFIDNNFSGFGTIQLLGGSHHSAKNNYVTHDEGVYCQFLSLSKSPEPPQSSKDVECVCYDSSTCQAKYYLDHMDSVGTEADAADCRSAASVMISALFGALALATSFFAI